MVRAISACCVRGALLTLVLVVCSGGVSVAGVLNSEGGEIGEDGVKVVGEMTDRCDVKDTSSEINERSVSGAGGVTDKGGMRGAGGVASKGVVDADDAVGDYDLIESNTHTPKIVTGEVKWAVIGTDGFVVLSCPDTDYTDTALEDVRFPHFNNITQSASLALQNCPVPRGSYADALAALHYRVADLRMLHIVFSLTQSLQASHLIKLPVEILDLIYDMKEGELVPLDPIILEPLLSLTTLDVANVILLPMPASSRLRSVTAMNGKSWSVWGGCDQLEQLNLISWEIRSPADVSLNWLANCTMLQKLSMMHQSMSSLVQIMQGVNTVPELLVIHNTVPFLYMRLLYKYLRGLESLVIVNNEMYEIIIDFIPTSLKYLELSNNDARYMYFSWLELLRQRPALRALILDNTPLSTEQQICNQLRAATAPQLTLQKLSLIKTGATRLCFGKWFSLQHLDLRNNNITTLELLELPSVQEMTVEVDLRGNPISSVPLTEEGYNTLLNKFNKSSVVVLIDLVLNCDCEHAWFARALRSLNLRVGDPLQGLVRCWNGQLLVDTPAEQLECERFPCEGCVCRRAWSDNATVAHCGGDLRTMPRVPDLRALHAAGNRIKTLQVDDLPETLLMLDLRGNQIARLNESVVNKLFSVQERRVCVAGNPFECDCGNRALLTALKQHGTTQVADYSSIVCEGSKKVLDAVDVDKLCAVPVGQMAVTATLVASGVLVALAAFAAAVYCRYERPLRIFLYARGLCLCCMQEDGSDDDRPFDAFVSFAHEDERLVTEQLLPGLELAPHSYKLCVHSRDWQPGELIPTQIRLSVERSRRTVIVLSRNFLRSMWAMLEFRTAHVNALSEGRVRIVVIVLDNVVDDEGLDAELRGYLRMHTYLRWGDPWFWDKLRYALPRRRAPSTEDVQHPVPQRAAVTGNVDFSLHELKPEGTPDDVNLSPNEFQPVSVPGDVNMSPHELEPDSGLGSVTLSPYKLQADGVPGDVNLVPHKLQQVEALGDVHLSPHELQPVGAPGEVYMSPHELQTVSAPGDVHLSPRELEPDSASGNVYLSPLELQIVSAPGNVNLSTHELQQVGAPGDVHLRRMSYNQLKHQAMFTCHRMSQLVSAPGNVNLSTHELQQVGAPDDVHLSPRELQPVNAPGNVNLSPRELEPVNAPGNVNLSPHELQTVSVPGNVN